MNRHRLRLVTFDAFGTLFRMREHPALTYQRIAQAHGLKVVSEPDRLKASFQDAYRKQGASNPVFGRLSQGSRPWWKSVVRNTLIGSGCPKADVDGALDPVFAELFDLYAQAAPYEVYPEVVPVLETLRTTVCEDKVPNGMGKGTKFWMGVVSNSDDRTEAILQSLGLAKYFDFVLTAYHFGSEKPGRGIFDEARLLARNCKAEECLHLGDDLERDYNGPKLIGWNSVLIRRNNDHPVPAGVATASSLKAAFADD
ncbi:HAD-like domain-containing protein [Polychytrium aggregatum]|uniref:HAD-like domain-containing protein n=1 Tax=Polychytrium aggregatum TaxID=110093 RepID=UPI0022FF3299|nr:HAD-like domain-containing protein [Polychytrium aggregatum]KAI9193729.1 HAD-like domain-containing protein [Polychytrium aggregatum]